MSPEAGRGRLAGRRRIAGWKPAPPGVELLWLLGVFAAAAMAQPEGWRRADVAEPPTQRPGAPGTRIGERYIDTLPKSEYARDPDETSWQTPAPGEPAVDVHPKGTFRVGEAGLERLVVIVAASGTERRVRDAELLLIDAEGETQWSQRAAWLGPTAQMRAVWLPVLAGGARLAARWGGREQAAAPAALAGGAPRARVEVAAPDEPHPNDHGWGLLPAWRVLVREGEPFEIAVGTAGGLAGELQITATLRGAPGVAELVEERVTLAGEAFAQTYVIPLEDTPVGEYGLQATVSLAGEELVRQGWEVQVCRAGEGARPFGARYADLRYPAPVHVNLAETLPWDVLWHGRDKRDVVIDFPGRWEKFTFWRGCCYVPCWALQNAWLTYEWLEAEPDHYGAIGCVEPLQDKECRFSTVRIVESSPARVIVHWRYALTDRMYQIIRGEWADEYFTFYPDAVGVRKLVAWFEGYGWHENQEFIFVNRPGRRPSEGVECGAVTLLSTRGDRAEAIWPQPRFSVDDWPDLIARVNVIDGAGPFQASRAGGSSYYSGVKVWADPPLEKPDIFNCYYHWPVTRGLRTVWLDDPRDFLRPTHSNLMNIVTDEDEEAGDHSVWRWLIGLAPKGERELREVAASWLQPGSVRSDELEAKGFDPNQRAYVLRAGRRVDRCTVTLTPQEGAPIINPALVIEDWGGSGRVEGPRGRRCEIGVERGGADLVVYLPGRFREETSFVVVRP